MRNVQINKNECEFIPRSRECDSMLRNSQAKTKQKPSKGHAKAKQRLHPFLKGTNKRFMAIHWLIQGEYLG